MELLKTELHCHNKFSNFHVGELDAPYDCSITIHQQLEQAYNLGLDALFVTNHNTLDGYNKILEYQNNHNKYQNIKVYPAEEVTTDTGAHVIVYGIYEELKPGLSFDEILDLTKKQDAVSSAPHPFSVVDALREKSKKCDLIEVFNSSNVDIFSNLKANEFASQTGSVGIAGSDSHVVSTLGRCINVVESENKLDDILSALRHGMVKIQKTGYTTSTETLEHLKYKINNSRDFIKDYVKIHYPNSQWITSFLLRLFDFNQNSYLWILIYKFCIFLLRRISHKVNIKNFDPSFVRDRDIKTVVKMAF